MWIYAPHFGAFNVVLCTILRYVEPVRRVVAVSNTRAQYRVSALVGDSGFAPHFWSPDLEKLSTVFFPLFLSLTFIPIFTFNFYFSSLSRSATATWGVTLPTDRRNAQKQRSRDRKPEKSRD